MTFRNRGEKEILSLPFSRAIRQIRANGTELYSPTVGIYNRCIKLFGRNHCGNFNMEGLATDSSVFPGCWKASLFFMALGLTVMGITVVAALLGCCLQSVGRKSIFNLAGVAQAVAGTFPILFVSLLALTALNFRRNNLSARDDLVSGRMGRREGAENLRHGRLRILPRELYSRLGVLLRGLRRDADVRLRGVQQPGREIDGERQSPGQDERRQEPNMPRVNSDCDRGETEQSHDGFFGDKFYNENHTRPIPRMNSKCHQQILYAQRTLALTPRFYISRIRDLLAYA
ncbi:hypothetical protein TSAR_012405 [Trichomalopsis sarcophagae]|uniref:Uncharacterized protein n=1 Tax=Trichomalopsis sarcophagae TaxID=543379 RepID=A0A232F4H8_9HYME|nr:hypothetical protein TSAR_012405 [Trichomalopsis sarcophagae]